ncbi:NUDIX domain-containing protein [Falsiruegeria mediterranea]|uniref:ADP-ribose pyrophosphatase n=1 Tax=Falsiruegeria mediterranea M17 TaxID=1200281 RepID=A0A2R8C8M7_9RHOB|nr:NUDIX domain-containing protein [Falsiruegeria mediterranea]SPJ28748.1 ADP-ribose pyrophosphatase [Falsiruegeria mediterranea M17]
MSDLFFYGTLRYVPLLELVLGRTADHINLTQAELHGYGAYSVRDQIFPMVDKGEGRVTHGLLVQGLTPGDIERVIYYEGGFDYDLQTLPLRTANGDDVMAEVFIPAPGLWEPSTPWSLNDWAAEWGELTVLAAEEVMSHFGHLPASDIAPRFPAIRMRAQGRLAARRREASPEWDTSRDVVLQDHRRPYLGYFTMEDATLRHRHFDGSMGPVLHRSALVNGQAAVILPYDPVRDCVLVVEQFRAPAYLIGDPNPWQIEAVAGMVDPGESPEEAARRETREEANIEVTELFAAGDGYSSSGSSTEFLHLFVGLADLDEPASTGGLETEGEDIRSHIVPFAAFMDQLDQGKLKNVPLISIANWLARNRERLRADI